jgi:hypothetical protein
MQTRTLARSYGEHDAASTAARGSTWSRVVVVSNRLPFRCTTAPDGTATLQPSSGGLVTALSPLLHSGIGGKWVGWLGGEEEGLEEALRSLADDASNPYELGIIQLNSDEEREYYSGYSNQVLVPLLVGTSGIVDQHVAHACWRTYLRTQQKFAREVMSDLRSGDIVWVQEESHRLNDTSTPQLAADPDQVIVVHPDYVAGAQIAHDLSRKLLLRAQVRAPACVCHVLVDDARRADQKRHQDLIRVARIVLALLV